MATRSIVPRADGEGSIGTESKAWGNAFLDNLNVDNLNVDNLNVDNLNLDNLNVDFTIDDSVAPTENTADIAELLNNICNMIKQMTGNTDWKTSPVVNIAAIISSLSSHLEVSTNSDGTFSCPSLGITGLMATNGYICFGRLFGGLILQWGLITLTVPEWTYNFPIFFPNHALSCHATDCGSGTFALGLNAINESQFTIYRDSDKSSNCVFWWTALGY